MKLKATLLAAVVIVAAVLACGGTETPATAPSRETPAFTQPLESQLLAPTTSRSLTSVPVSTQPPTDLSQFSPTPSHIVHIVQSGETLGKIAKQYCDDFATQAAAQACFNYCWRVVGYDVHWLDDDKDGIACEWNP
jgi:hypothetical protein